MGWKFHLGGGAVEDAVFPGKSSQKRMMLFVTLFFCFVL